MLHFPKKAPLVRVKKDKLQYFELYFGPAGKVASGMENEEDL